MRDKGLAILIFIVSVSVIGLMYSAILMRNGDLEKQIKNQQNLIATQKAEIEFLEAAIEDREMEISLWGNILDRLAMKHPEEARQIAREFGVQTGGE
jgi:hypothetical protein